MDISFSEAFGMTMEAISPLTGERVDISRLTGRVVSENVVSLVDAPSADISLKDGYAVCSADVERARDDQPVMLNLQGVLFAGARPDKDLGSGQAIKITTGAPLPRGADCVVSQEFGSDNGSRVRLVRGAAPGQNVLQKGSDLSRGQVIAEQGTRLRPGGIGFIAAAGHASAMAHRSPRVALIATGDEVIAPGRPFEAGKVFASNLVTTAAWCALFGVETHTEVVPDRTEAITDAILRMLDRADCIITSGGAWKSERDLTVSVLDSLGWKKIYHRVRMGPGKAVGFGILGSRPVFCLPGGPPSNQMAFLQLALPGLRALEGEHERTLPVRQAMLAQSVSGQRDWTQFIQGTLEKTGEGIVFHPLRMQSRLRMLAQSQAIASIPEGEERIDKGTLVDVQIL